MLNNANNNNNFYFPKVTFNTYTRTPRALDASTLPLGYRGGGILRFENAHNFFHFLRYIIKYKTAVMSANAFHIRLIVVCY